MEDDDSFFLLMNKKKMKNPRLYLNKDDDFFSKSEKATVNSEEDELYESEDEISNEEPVDQNDEILEILKDRMSLGRERYGHGLRINDDTRKWGTKENSWEEMALEEILDGMIYTCCAILRLRKNRREFENVQITKEGYNRSGQQNGDRSRDGDVEGEQHQ